MQKDYVYPEVGNRIPPRLWKEYGSHPINVSAKAKAEEILASHFPQHINDEVDARIRSSYDIRLPREQMKPSMGSDSIDNPPATTETNR
jgi:trimethylamine--corrinoid protein Co-methyltransferase